MSVSQNFISEDVWDKERVKTELRRKGYSLAYLDRAHDYAPGYFSKSLSQPLRHAEKIIADILGVHPSVIWPNRYGSDGRPHQGRFLPENDSLVTKVAVKRLGDVS